jgi:predicted DNA-binding protein (UPF0251 family)
MPRCPKRRRCRDLGENRVFKPAAIPLSGLERVHLGLDELEAMRLCDLDGYDQTEAGTRMGVSRGTVQRLLARGRGKLVQVIIANQALVVEPHAGGAIQACFDEDDSSASLTTRDSIE